MRPAALPSLHVAALPSLHVAAFPSLHAAHRCQQAARGELAGPSSCWHYTQSIVARSWCKPHGKEADLEGM